MFSGLFMYLRMVLSSRAHPFIQSIIQFLNQLVHHPPIHPYLLVLYLSANQSFRFTLSLSRPIRSSTFYQALA